MRGVELFVLWMALLSMVGCASTIPPQKYEAESIGACWVKAVTHPEPGKGPVQITRDDGESDRQHYLVTEFNVTYAASNSYGGTTLYATTETVALAPTADFAAFSKPGAISASQAGVCTLHSPRVMSAFLDANVPK